MKNLSKIISGTIVMLGITTVSFAQVSATATATATIVAPIAITKTTDMDFGNIAVSARGGTVILSPASARTITGGITLPAVTGTVTAASFNVTGTDGYTYAITLPATDVVLNSGSNSMIANAFTSTPSATGTLSAGAQTIAVGATLNVAAAQPAGVYVSTPFTVTVNYN